MRALLCSVLGFAVLSACKDDAEAPDPAGADATVVEDAAAALDADSGADAGGFPDAFVDTSTAPMWTAVRIPTADGLELAGAVVVAPGVPQPAPGVVLVHQFQRDGTQWGDIPDRLATAGYRVLVFDLRGHGGSDPYDGALSDLLTDPNGAPRDVEAALTFITTVVQADPDRIAIVGTSIGANLAVAAAIGDKAKTYVAYSTRQAPTESLAGAPAEGMRSVLYLAGENDPGNQAIDSQVMFEATAEPRLLIVYPGSARHGIELLLEEPGADAELFDWLGEHL